MVRGLAQAPAVADASGWTVTTWIALAGALISVATLAVTTLAASRRERAKWARETLAEAFFAFVDSSYKAGQAGKDLWHLRLNGKGGAEADQLRKMDESREDLIHMQTKIRILAPTKVLEAAKQLRWKIDNFRRSLSDEKELSAEEYRRHVVEIAAMREQFVLVAKSSMSLPK